MARRTFDMIDICEIFTHWHAGGSKNEIAGSLGLSRNTVRKYLAAAEAAGMAPGGLAVSQQEWAGAEVQDLLVRKHEQNS
jgi:predicted transcriptional regulator